MLINCLRCSAAEIKCNYYKEQLLRQLQRFWMMVFNLANIFLLAMKFSSYLTRYLVTWKTWWVCLHGSMSGYYKWVYGTLLWQFKTLWYEFKGKWTLLEDRWKSHEWNGMNIWRKEWVLRKLWLKTWRRDSWFGTDVFEECRMNGFPNKVPEREMLNRYNESPNRGERKKCQENPGWKAFGRQ